MNKNEPVIRVLLADDHRVLLASLRALLEHHGFEIVGEATTGEQALAVATKVHPQVIVMDLEMPGTGGLAAAHRMKQTAPSAKVLILSAHDDEADVLEALNDAGVAGYLVKSDAPEELINAVPCGRERQAVPELGGGTHPFESIQKSVFVRRPW